MKSYLHPTKWIIVCFITSLLFFSNHTFIQAKEENLRYKTIDRKNEETLNIEDPELKRQRDQVKEKLIRTHFFSKVNQKLIQHAYKKYSFKGEYDINYHVMELEIDEKPGESKVKTIENIEKIVNQLGKENNLVPSHARVIFH
ncbi:hypothetical protein [Priestia megaterium]|uniref:hypothetical protein n=1 Tax=Priestia megaterium TaxID=1404 RepID=UPI002E1CFE31|nr:hypothetical protein [Priestia megaterium]